jgi:membrane protein
MEGQVRSYRLIRDLGLAAVLGVSAAYVFSRIERPGESSRDERYDSETAHRTGEGADAEVPSNIPAHGWWEIARRTYHEVDRDRVQAVAAGVTFYSLLALFPALTAFVSLYGLLADPATISDQLALLDGLLPSGATDFLREQIGRIAAGGDRTLSFALSISLALAIWSANAGVKAIFDALNVAYGEYEKRGFIRLNIVSLAFTLGILVFLLGAISAIAVVPIALDYLYLGRATEWLIAVGRWPLIVAILLLGLSTLYRYGPSRDQAQWKWVSPGALFAAAGWLIASILFSWYVANFEDYNKTYGTVGAVIGLLTWMWLSATIVLVGAELNSEAERQTYHDTTKGPPMPIGLRGADAADRKG